MRDEVQEFAGTPAQDQRGAAVLQEGRLADILAYVDRAVLLGLPQVGGHIAQERLPACRVVRAGG